MADGFGISSSIPFTHDTSGAGTLRVEEGTAASAAAALVVPLTVFRSVTIILNNVLDFTATLASVFGSVTPRTIAFFVAATLSSTLIRSHVGVTQARNAVVVRLSTDNSRIPKTFVVVSAGIRSHEAFAAEITMTEASRPHAIISGASINTLVAESALEIARESDRREVTFIIGITFTENSDLVAAFVASTLVIAVVTHGVGVTRRSKTNLTAITNARSSNFFPHTSRISITRSLRGVAVLTKWTTSTNTGKFSSDDFAELREVSTLAHISEAATVRTADEVGTIPDTE